MARVLTDRELAKADRRSALLREAARLFAIDGFNGVSLEDLGAAVGISGPAVYRHFAGKQALLAALLIGVSRSLLDGGRLHSSPSTPPEERLGTLVGFHVDFSLSNADVIRVQDRDLDKLTPDDSRTVRRLQREYVELWVAVLSEVRGTTDVDALRTRAHACFGLMNATSHLVPSRHSSTVRSTLVSMAVAALTSA